MLGLAAGNRVRKEYSLPPSAKYTQEAINIPSPETPKLSVCRHKLYESRWYGSGGSGPMLLYRFLLGSRPLSAPPMGVQSCPVAIVSATYYMCLCYAFTFPFTSSSCVYLLTLSSPSPSLFFAPFSPVFSSLSTLSLLLYLPSLANHISSLL